MMIIWCDRAGASAYRVFIFIFCTMLFKFALIGYRPGAAGRCACWGVATGNPARGGTASSSGCTALCSEMQRTTSSCKATVSGGSAFR